MNTTVERRDNEALEVKLWELEEKAKELVDQD